MREASRSIYERLLRDRIVFLATPIDDDVANTVIAQLLFLESEDRTGDIALYVNSPGGSVTSSLAIVDAMEALSCPVATVCMSLAAGMAALLVASGARGRRFALKHASISLAPMEGRTQSPEAAAQLARMEAAVVEKLARATGQPCEAIREYMRSSVCFSAEQAVKAGFIDGLVDRPERHPR